MNIRTVLLSFLTMAGCTSNVQEFGDVVSVEKADIEKVSFESDANLASYAIDKQTEKVEWMGCRIKKAKGLALLVNRDGAPFNPKGMCEGWLAQAFLAEGYDVLGVNRPGLASRAGRSILADLKASWRFRRP